MKKLSILWILLFASSVLFAETTAFEYVFPIDGSELLPCTTQIIVRPGDIIDRTSVNSALFEVTGSKSGKHDGRALLSTDGRTVVFKPHSSFQPDESVIVNVHSGLKSRGGETIEKLSLQFATTPLDKPLNPYEYLPQLNPYRRTEASRQTIAAADRYGNFPEIEILINNNPAPGHFFITPTHFISGDGHNMIFDNQGQVVYANEITSGVPMDFKVLPNGLLSYGVMSKFYPFGGGGETEFFMMDSSFTVVDRFQMGNGYIADFHEFQLLPNGHALLLTYDLQPVDLSRIAPGGHPGALVAGSIIQELDVDKNVIFQWRSWDHYKLTDSYADLTQPIFDAIHINSLELDSDSHLLISTLGLAEITKINRQTGAIIWRMGGKNNQFTFFNDDATWAPLYFMFQHDVRRLPNGNITLFDGGEDSRRRYSRVVEYKVDEAAKTATKVWDYRHSPDIYTPTMGSMQRLPNGNSVIGWGLASMYGLPAVTEVDPSGNVVLEMKFKQVLTASYRAFKFQWAGGKPAAQVMRQELLPGNTYVFDNADDKTGVSIRLNKMGGFGYNDCTVRRHAYAPRMPEFVGKAPMVLPVRVAVDQFNIFDIQGDIVFDADFYRLARPDSVLVYFREFENRGLFIALPTEYNHVTGKVKATMTNFGEFILAYPDYPSPALPPLPIYPDDKALVDQTMPVRLEWTPVGYVTDYTLQVSETADFQSPLVNVEFLAPANYTLTTLKPQTAYFWRVKAYNNAGEGDWCAVRQFTTAEPYLRVLSPNGGDKWRRGLEYYIRWQGIIKEDVILELYKGDNLHALIDTAAQTGAFRWEFPINLPVGGDYRIKVKSATRPQIMDFSDAVFAVVDTATFVSDKQETLVDFQLAQNHPNPFNASTQIRYRLPNEAQMTLEVYDLNGRRIAVLAHGVQPAGEHQIVVNGENFNSGIYFYRLQVAGQETLIRKMTMVK